ncbi:MAG TPA: inositol monophosphatase family protein [Acidimicrobiia bacterium]|nr:inositol monophosphatase family protein [Acidimicrobiia bacterium]
MSARFSAEIDLARSAVRTASRLCLAVAAAGLDRIEKREREPATVADFGSQAVLLRAIGAEFPGDGVRAEEGSADLVAAGEAAVAGVAAAVAAAVAEPVESAAVLGWIDHRGGLGDRVWAIDPIDGTKGFLRGEQFAVAAGLIVDGIPVVGVLGCPRLELSGMQGVLVWGGPGIGAFVESLGGGKVRPISVSAVSDPARARMLGSVESAHGDPGLLQRIAEQVGIGGGWVRIDSQAKYAAVAAGMADVYIRPRNRRDWREHVWDHAAGAAIVAGAGGTISDLDGLPLDFTTGDVLEHNRGLVVSNGAMHPGVLAALAAIR